MKERFAIWLAPQNGERREVAPLRQLGWAFLLAWVFCVFYTNAAGVLSGDAIPDAGEAAAGASSGASSMGAALFYAVLPLAASVATLAAIVLAEPRIGSPTSHRPLFVVAPALTAASTPFMFVSVADPGLNAALFGIGAVATGIGSALLWAMWGEYYAVIPRDRAEWLAPVSAVSAAVIVLLVSAMDGWVPVAVAAALPLLSGLCFHLAWTPEAARTEEALATAHRFATEQRSPLAGLGRTGFGILVVFSIVSIAGMMSAERVEGIPLQAILLFSALMMAVVAAMAISGPRRISLFFLYRWMCPTLVIGFAAVILLGQAGALVAVAASLGGRFTFCLIAQIYFANYAAAGRATPAQASSLGWLFVHAGDLLGVVLWIVLEPLMLAQPTGLTAVSVGCIVVLVTVTMAVMGETSTFLRIPETAKDQPHAHGKGIVTESPDAHDAMSLSRMHRRPLPHQPPTHLARCTARRASTSSPASAASRRARPRCSRCSPRAVPSPTSATSSSSAARRRPPTPSISTQNWASTPAKSSSTSSGGDFGQNAKLGSLEGEP